MRAYLHYINETQHHEKIIFPEVVCLIGICLFYLYFLFSVSDVREEKENIQIPGFKKII